MCEVNVMDIVEFTENICGTKLDEWQKPYIRFLYDLTRKYDVKVVMGKNGQVFTYIHQKELSQNGNTNNH
jgi:hypothetical protein